MNETETNALAALDRPEILMFLFHPRPEIGTIQENAPFKDLSIPIEEGITIGARFHEAGFSAHTLLFFHGNGEIVSDYDELGPLYNRLGINFLPVDYRGYGRSTGKPTVTAMMNDCHIIFDFVCNWLSNNGYTSGISVMGRSLGSASALEIANTYQEKISALIIESGFAQTTPLLRLLGINTDALGLEEKSGFDNVHKIRSFTKPCLIIHAERDHIIPFSDGQALFDACGAEEKSLLKIPGANHNDIFLRGINQYLAAVDNLINRIQ
jgi:fermentation-respiration switch protein FrsA (DUF1100 family)